MNVERDTMAKEREAVRIVKEDLESESVAVQRKSTMIDHAVNMGVESRTKYLEDKNEAYSRGCIEPV